MQKAAQHAVQLFFRRSLASRRFAPRLWVRGAVLLL
jgi:hypothetical protein